MRRSQTVGDATNLNKYVEKDAPGLDLVTKEEHDRILEEHLLEVSIKEYEVAKANYFLPLMMIPEAAAYSLDHQSRSPPSCGSILFWLEHLVFVGESLLTMNACYTVYEQSLRQAHCLCLNLETVGHPFSWPSELSYTDLGVMCYHDVAKCSNNQLQVKILLVRKIC